MRLSLAAVFIVAPLLVSSSALAYSDKVRKNCRQEQMAHCSQHDLGSAGLKACMHKAGPQLRPACVNALIQSGEIAGKAQQRAEKR